MPKGKPKQWSDRATLVRDLRNYNWQKNYTKPLLLDVRQMLRKCVAANTFRAFHNCPKKPSVVFRTWGEAALTERDFLDSLKSVRSRNSYDEWLTAFAKDFRNYWRREMRKPISFGHSLKLPNLVVKGLLARDLPGKMRQRLVWFLHVPLDSYTIQAIRNCFDGSSAGIGTIPSNASMGFVKDQRMYDSLQEQIRSLAKEAGVPPIALDYLAWDGSH